MPRTSLCPARAASCTSAATRHQAQSRPSLPHTHPTARAGGGRRSSSMVVTECCNAKGRDTFLLTA
eukprot:365037-Chlamydomonas_euryale.AAC.8